jgi:tetratricopeptide (TPR) repeat protein
VTEEELSQELHAAYHLPRGPARWAAIDAVLRQADAVGLEEFAFDARIHAISEFHHGGDQTRAFLAFSWCLAAYDRATDLVGQGHGHTLLWRFKWIVWALPQFPEIPLDRTQAVLDDMQRRYLLAGHSLHAVYQHRWLVAHHTGDADGAAHWYEELVNARRDGLSDCHACVPSSQVRHLATVGRFEEAVTIGQPYSRGGCSEQPHWMLSELLLPYLRTGRLAAAVDAHRTAYRLMRSDHHHLDNISQHVLFCGLTGNEARGLELVERHLPWLERPATPFAALEFLNAAAMVLRRLRETGRGDLTVRRRSEHGVDAGESTVDDLHAELVTRAQALAARFDERNQNTHQSERCAGRMALEPIVGELSLAPPAAAPGGRADPGVAEAVDRVAQLTAAGDAPAAARAHLELAHLLRNASRWEDATEAAEEATAALSRAGLGDDVLRGRYLLFLLYARSYQRQGEAAAQVDALTAAARLPDGVPSKVELLQEAAGRLAGVRRQVEWLRAAADEYRLAGDGLREFRVLHRALWSAVPVEPAEHQSIVELLGRSGRLAPTVELNDDDRSHAELAAARVLAFVAPAEALPRVERAIEAYRALDNRVGERLALTWQSAVLLELDRFPAAEAQARAALALDPDGDPWPINAVLTGALIAQGRTAEAEALMAEHDLTGDDVEDVLDAIARDT